MNPRLLLVAICAAATGCAQLPPRPALPDETAPAAAVAGALAERIAPAEGAHPGESGFRLLSDGIEAFVVRMQSARLATRSLDVQSYIWHSDLTGRFLAAQLLESADRGVRVRLLVDDLDARTRNDGFAALAAHPNVDVRMFNPWATRSGAIAGLGESVASFKRINRRMHNKTWIADNRIAVVGGRNIGDEYFGAGEEINFVDLDFAMIGPVVRDASASFNKYWNSASAYPMETLDPESVDASALDKLRKRLAEHAVAAKGSDYALALAGSDLARRMISGEWPMQWSSRYEFVSDDPRKIAMKKRDAKRTQVGLALVPMLRDSKSRVTIISPYFVPGDVGTQDMVGSVGRGKDVRVLTNSLVANDVAAVHGGYSRYRKALVEGGVAVWELKPTSGSPSASFFGSSGASLHTKAFAVDGQKLFVGSYNLDPRSTWLNCEQGVLIEDSVLASQLEALFAVNTSGQHAWRVTLKDRKLHWSDGSESFDKDPRASGWQRFQAWVARVLHLDAQL